MELSHVSPKPQQERHQKGPNQTIRRKSGMNRGSMLGGFLRPIIALLLWVPMTGRMVYVCMFYYRRASANRFAGIDPLCMSNEDIRGLY